MKKDRDVRRIRTRATPLQAWRAFADPAIITGWFADRATGRAEPGEHLTHIFDAFDLELPHRVVEAVPGERLVLEGRAPSGLTFRQEVHVHTDGGHTVVELVHSGFGDDADWDGEYEGIDSGWKLALAILGHYLDARYGRPRTGYFAMRPAQLEYAALAPLFRSAEGLRRWLTTDGAIGEVGSPVALTLDGGERLTGVLLADSGRELALRWDELEGALELKAFDLGNDQRAIALRAHSWAATPPPRDRLEPWMHAALERLAAALVTPS